MWSLELRADVRVAYPLIARAHLLLRFDQGRWVAMDNGSPNGMFVNGRRVPVVDIRDSQSINIGKPDGPRLTFEVGHHEGAVGQLPATVEAVPVIALPGTQVERAGCGFRNRPNLARRIRFRCTRKQGAATQTSC